MLYFLQESRVNALQEYVQQLCEKVDTEAMAYLNQYESSLKGIQMYRHLCISVCPTVNIFYVRQYLVTSIQIFSPKLCLFIYLVHCLVQLLYFEHKDSLQILNTLSA